MEEEEWEEEEWVSTHSRLKAAGKEAGESYTVDNVSTHSRLKAAGLPPAWAFAQSVFQHTAA